MTTYAVVDLEATGVTTGHLGHIIQIGITFIEQYQITDTVSFLVKPPIPINKQVSNLTGITDETVNEAPYFEEIAEYIYTILQGCIFVGHNVFFDYNLLNEEFKRVNICDFKCDTVDTIDLTRIIYPYEKKFSLKYLVQSKNITQYMDKFIEHQADSDSLATAHLFLFLLKNMSQLPNMVRNKIVIVLKKNEDYLYKLFEDNIVIDDYELLTNKSIKEIKRRQLKRKIEHNQQNKILFSNLNDFSVEISQQTTVIICQNEESLHNIITQYDNVHPIYHHNYFYDDKNIDFIINHLDYLNDKEVKQFCSFLVWQSITTDNFLGTLKLSSKLHHYLSFHINENELFDKQIMTVCENDIVVMTMQTYLEHQLYLHERLQHAHYIFEQIDESYMTLVQYFKKEIDISYLLINLQQLKQKVVDDTAISRYLSKLYSILTQLFKSYPQLNDNRDTEECTQVLFIDQLNDNLLQMLNELKSIVKNLLSYANQYQYFNIKVLQKINFILFNLQFIEEELTKQDYVTLKIKKSGHHQQIAFVLNKAYLNDWFAKNVIERNSQITFFTTIPLTKDLIEYYKHIYGFRQLEYIYDLKSQQKQQGVSWLYVPNQVNISHYKDTLIVKRVMKFLQLLKGNSLVLVSSMLYSDKFLALDSIFCQLKYFTPKLTETNEKINVVLTYEQLMNTTYQLDEFENVVLIKLPFDSPKYEESKNINSSTVRFFNYFEKITLPKMIVKMKKIEQLCHNKKLYILDNRIENSSYSEKLLNNIMIKKIDVETIDF